MRLAILMGCAGNLMATFLTILGGYALLTVTGVYSGMKFSVIFTLLVCFAVARGILRYAEQASNHYIAFKLLACIRHQVFDSLRQLALAKLDGAKKGNLISIITSDIELLEAFYAHTISHDRNRGHHIGGYDDLLRKDTSRFRSAGTFLLCACRSRDSGCQRTDRSCRRQGIPGGDSAL